MAQVAVPTRPASRRISDRYGQATAMAVKNTVSNGTWAKAPQTKRGFVLLPRRGIVERSRPAGAPAIAPGPGRELRGWQGAQP